MNSKTELMCILCIAMVLLYL